jgi:hypothetical protein
MATAELSSRTGSRRGRLARVWVSSWLSLWLASAVVLLLTALTPGAGTLAREVLGARLTAAQNPAPSLLRSLSLAAHNAPMFGWPLLLGAFAIDGHTAARRAADWLASGWLVANVLPVGAALGAYGVRILGFLPQLPAEWAALAIGATAWRVQRHRGLSGEERVSLVLWVAVLTVLAAVVETWGVPHR